jgi:hypothetical protein
MPLLMQGGETAFPSAGAKTDGSQDGFSECGRKSLAYKPSKGSALLFYSTKPDGTLVCARAALQQLWPVIVLVLWCCPVLVQCCCVVQCCYARALLLCSCCGAVVVQCCCGRAVVLCSCCGALWQAGACLHCSTAVVIE